MTQEEMLQAIRITNNRCPFCNCEVFEAPVAGHIFCQTCHIQLVDTLTEWQYLKYHIIILGVIDKDFDNFVSFFASLR